MNHTFEGDLKLYYKSKPKGYASKAAKAAFNDILKDPNMTVKTEIFDSYLKDVHIILNEDILSILLEDSLD